MIFAGVLTKPGIMDVGTDARLVLAARRCGSSIYQCSAVTDFQLRACCRTGVLTKLDIMDPGTDARAVLDGSAVRLKLGWTAVVNRGQQHINANMQQDVRFAASPRTACGACRKSLNQGFAKEQVV